ncbi:hypothetical protein BU24DRAFT_419671 [Aaosphaeria arxii CBS 175.79]|uniref:Cryptic loci regulator 2 N-terminal domain-containing protein n=1 Tax=Aaosphaeria arxii CBS 175.79 TaxID=1450172 RepID=A0A6A5Y6B2_9PLEO|nr:uncharacterized protein BU24DRAFT_419671 [Aaosphaeria arxii CBS 175.79]KAF2020094.1 hypothetical protein BU24DRAFT_419671 [Aaosphaeria arxii CBS 175.79]
MAQVVTTAFWPIFARRSDGHEVVTQKGIQIKNAPNTQQLDRTPNAQGQCDYYRLLDRDEPKHIDWRKKLGGMLLRELGGKEHEDKWSQTVLWDLPEGYRLYEHIKSKADGQAKAVKNHSGGGHDRQDAYLYGYPKGPKKRFRSPIEFFPHLLWLCSDDTNDTENCSCKMCSPVQLETEKPAPTPQGTPPIKNEPQPATSLPSAQGRLPQTGTLSVQHIQSSNGSTQNAVPTPTPSIIQLQQQPKPSTQPQQSLQQQQQVQPLQQSTPQPQSQPQPQAQPHPRPQQASAPPAAVSAAPAPNPVPQASQLPQPRSIDQQVDGQYHKFLARIGETVWFHREKTRAWGLGLVVRRWKAQDPNGIEKPTYLVQPLSHPFDSPAPEIIQSDDRLKPWLAWSAPLCTYGYLQQNQHLSYDQVDWRSLLSGQFGDGNPEVDASILAAKAVDITYTLCEQLRTVPHVGMEDRFWNSMYFGAERIWIGEPVRLRIGSGTDIMVISSIVERAFTNAANSQTGTPPSQVHIIGDVYTYATHQVPMGQQAPAVPHNSNIPIRMREDMIWRNKILLEETQSIAYWKLVATQQRLDISEIKGRWYEASVVFVEPFKTAVQKKEGGNGVWMNSRGDATGVGKISGVKKEHRTQAFSHAIPKGCILVEGFESPKPEEQGNPHGNHVQNMDLVGGVGTSDAPFILDDFMNLEGMDGDHMGFETQFTF